MERTFPNRVEAGRQLAQKLEKYAGRDDVIVLGLPAVVCAVANEVAKRLRAPLEFLLYANSVSLVSKSWLPAQSLSGGVRVLK